MTYFAVNDGTDTFKICIKVVIGKTKYFEVMALQNRTAFSIVTFALFRIMLGAV